VLLGFVAKIANSCHQAQCVEKRAMHVIFQNGVMEIHQTVQKMYICKTGSLAWAWATAMKRDVITIMSSAGILLALMPGMHLGVAVGK
jgi:hypothetical protein